MSIFRSIACTATLLAGATLIVAPVAAATRTVPITVPLSARPAQTLPWSSADETFNEHRWRGHRRHHDGFDGGDLLTVLLIGGGIAAVTSAIGNDREKRRTDRTDGRDYPGTDDRRTQYRSDGRYRSGGQYRSDGTRMPDQDYGRRGDTGGADRPYDYREGRDDVDRRSDQLGSREADRAVDACSAEAARSGEIDEIFNVDKIDGEWRVKGDYRDGREFSCSVDGNGKAYVGRDDQAANKSGGSDDRYATGYSADFTDPRGR